MLAASGWWVQGRTPAQALYDPCCGSGTIAIEAAQIACGIAPGIKRRFAFEKYLPFQRPAWAAVLQQAQAEQRLAAPGQACLIFGSDVAHRMIDFAQRNAARAGVAQAIEFRGGDALQRMPPLAASPHDGAVLMVNPPYGERVNVAGVAARVAQFGARELAQVTDGGAFLQQLGNHWKKNYANWCAWLLSPDLKLPGKLRLKESRRVPLWNGPIECRLFRFDLQAPPNPKRPSAPVDLYPTP